MTTAIVCDKQIRDRRQVPASLLCFWMDANFAFIAWKAAATRVVVVVVVVVILSSRGRSRSSSGS